MPGGIFMSLENGQNIIEHIKPTEPAALSVENMYDGNGKLERRVEKGAD